MTRIAAWLVLRSGSPTPLRVVDRVARERGLDPRDRGLLRRLVGCEVRRRGSLRALVAHFARGKPSADLAAHLRLGLAQLFFLDQVPVHAAVSETVDAATRTLGQSKARYVNGVLRSALRARKEGSCGDPRRDLVGRPWHLEDPVFRDPESHPLLWGEDALSIPAALLKRWEKRHGWDRTQELARVALDEPDLSVRAVGVPRDDLIAELAALEVGDPRLAAHPDVLRLPASSTAALVASAPFVEGRATIQGETALRAAELVAGQEGERILDLCAAPGGKTAVLAATGAQVVALDLHAGRLSRVQGGLERLHTPPVARVASDGTGALHPDAPPFDRVLVDLPCSNTGVLAARPAARWRFGPTSQKELTGLGKRLIGEAAARVRPGGRLVVSTCSVEPEENERQVKAFLAENPGWELVDSHQALPTGALSTGVLSSGHLSQGVETEGPVDGGYAAALVRPS